MNLRDRGERAFFLKDDLRGPEVTAANVLSAMEGVMPTFKIIDSRFRDWKITIKDSIVDNASSAAIILGGKLTPISDVGLCLVGMVLAKMPKLSPLVQEQRFWAIQLSG